MQDRRLKYDKTTQRGAIVSGTGCYRPEAPTDSRRASDMTGAAAKTSAAGMQVVTAAALMAVGAVGAIDTGSTPVRSKRTHENFPVGASLALSVQT